MVVDDNDSVGPREDQLAAAQQEQFPLSAQAAEGMITLWG